MPKQRGYRDVGRRPGCNGGGRREGGPACSGRATATMARTRPWTGAYGRESAEMPPISWSVVSSTHLKCARIAAASASRRVSASRPESHGGREVGPPQHDPSACV